MALSSATRRADSYAENGSEWFCGFSYTEVKGLGYEVGVHRRDPSSVIEHDGTYYVYYTKSVGAHFGHSAKRDSLSKIYPWDNADLYYATSADGLNWSEQGVAVARGEKGAYDERTVCTPDVLEHDGKIYLVYQAIAQVNYTGRNENVAMAVADHPSGPFKKLNKEILSPMEDGRWFGENATGYNVGDFEGVTHDPSLYYYNNKFYLYYKCGANSLYNLKCFGKDTRWGVAISDNVTGPYTHSEFNPITNSGHETMLWNYDGGIAALLNRDGPEKDTIQYAKDGVNFEIMSRVTDTPQAGGAFRCKNPDIAPLEGIRWGMCHYDERGSIWNYIVRFDLDMRHPYAVPYQYPPNNTVGFGTW